MIFISYKELSNKFDYPSMREHMEKEVYPNKEKIIHFLLHGNPLMAKISYDRDVFTGEVIRRPSEAFQHGKYGWPNCLAWYVEKYNLRLPADFEAYILENAK